MKEEPSSPFCFGSLASEVLPPREREGGGGGNKISQLVSELITEYLNGINVLFNLECYLMKYVMKDNDNLLDQQIAKGQPTLTC